MINNKIGITIIGATSYGAKELLRLIEFHDQISLAQIVSHSQAGKTVDKLHPNSSKYKSALVDSELDLKKLSSYSHKFILLCLPSELSAEFIGKNFKEITEKQISIIDLSGCCRIKDHSKRLTYYPESKEIEKHLQEFQYGLSEIYADKIKSTKHVSNPGCFATASILSLHPISDLDIQSISIDGKSGSSGAGKSIQQKFHHPELHANSFPYKIGSHRHEPEIKENFSNPSTQNLVFCPHVIPISRGMQVTTYVHLNMAVTKEDVLEKFTKAYKDQTFIRIKEEPVQISNVAGSNFCDIHVTTRDKVIIVTTVIDNLVKGMAGQAIQNINIKSELPQHYGLAHAGMGLI